ncbi:MAG: bifunctional pyr operon transcriptional regulator/uracil phosphoribosyltransferase PyrR [Candidatus Altiarchaeota archaeon]
MSVKQVMDDGEIGWNLAKIAKAILAEYPDTKNMVVLGIITRGDNLARRIAKDLGKGVKVGSLDARPHRDDLKSESTEDRSDIPFSITDKDVILVDDVMSTGRTIRAALDAVMGQGRPRSIKTAVLIDRGHRELPITADFVGAKIPTSVSEEIRVKLKEIDGGKDGAYIMTR